MSRERYAEVVGAMAASDLSLRFERDRYADLLARYHMLRLQGFAPETAPPVTVPRPAADPVLSAIARKAGRNTTLRQAMEAQAAKDRSEGIAESLILAQIERGRTPDEDEVFV